MAADIGQIGRCTSAILADASVIDRCIGLDRCSSVVADAPDTVRCSSVKADASANAGYIRHFAITKQL
jgi:hypothetical protein